MPTYPFRTALVTGASSGIGEAMVRRLAADGVACTVVARRLDRLEALAAELPGITPLAADLATDAGVDLIAERLRTTPVDLLVNNAGFGSSGPLVSIDSGRVADEVCVNVLALTRLTRAVLEPMTQARRGWILNVSSIASFQPAPEMAVYAATKAYVTSFTESLHEELRGTGVHATALCPGLTRTEFQAVSNTRGFEDRYPAVAWLTADQVAREALADIASGRALSVPGLQYKGMTSIVNVTPRWIKRRLSTLVTTSRR